MGILVDLSGRMPRNRLLVFARRPAPVEVHYIGDPGTTALDALDYGITDAHHGPEGTTEPYHAERVVRVPGCCWC